MSVGGAFCRLRGHVLQDGEKIVLAVFSSLLSDWPRGKRLPLASFSTIMMCSEVTMG